MELDEEEIQILQNGGFQFSDSSFYDNDINDP